MFILKILLFTFVFYFFEMFFLKVRTLLKQIVREWADEGNSERQQSFTPLINAVEQIFKETTESNESPSVLKKEDFNILVPGCGAGRLPFEFFRR